MKTFLTWLKGYEEKPLSIIRQGDSDSSKDYGVNPRLSPWESEEIEAFKDKGSSCEIFTQSGLYCIEVVDFPRDKWGNTGTFSDGLNLQEGYYEVGFSDPQEQQFNPDFINQSKITDPLDFLEWLETEKSDLIGVINERLVCESVHNNVTFWTTNQTPDSPEWVAAINEYLALTQDENLLQSELDRLLGKEVKLIEIRRDSDESEGLMLIRKLPEPYKVMASEFEEDEPAELKEYTVNALDFTDDLDVTQTLANWRQLSDSAGVEKVWHAVVDHESKNE